MVIIDFKQAYDSINKNQLWIELENFGLPKKLVRLIKNCYLITFCKIHYLGETLSPFEVKKGVRKDTS